MISFVGGDSPAFFDIRGQITKGTGNVIIVPPLALRIGRQNLKKETETSLTVSNNDGTISDWTIGMDYYIYACRPNEGAEPTLLLSVNSTYPNGYSANNSRKIGGFHYGIVRTGPNPGDVTEGIVPNSVWDLKNRPRCSPEGMAKVGSVWVDIYLASDDGQGGIKSAYNATPLTGTEGLNWYSFVERAAKVGKRLMTYAEWCAAAQGSPQGLDDSNENAWTKTTNTDRNPTGLIPNATSIYNIRDCVGNVWEWLDEMVVRWDSTTGSWGWYDVMEGLGFGQLNMYLPNALVAMRAGGQRNDGVQAGARTISVFQNPWNMLVGAGVRCACDTL